MRVTQRKHKTWMTFGNTSCSLANRKATHHKHCVSLLLSWRRPVPHCSRGLCESTHSLWEFLPQTLRSKRASNQPTQRVINANRILFAQVKLCVSLVAAFFSWLARFTRAHAVFVEKHPRSMLIFRNNDQCAKVHQSCT